MPKRRGNGEGTVYQRKDGRWMAQVTVDLTLEGKSKRKTFYGSTRKEAVEKMAEVLHEIKVGSYSEPSKITLKAWIEKWLEVYKKPIVKPTTFEGYRTAAVSHIIPLLGGVKLKDLQPSMLQEFYNEKITQGLSDSYIRHMHVVLKGALQQSVREGLIARNPVDATSPPGVNGSGKMNILTEMQLKTLMEYIKGDKLEAAYVLAINTGLRRGELLGLTWDCLNLEKGNLIIKQQLIMAGGKPELDDSTKSCAGKRGIPISYYVVKVLKKHKLKQSERKMLTGERYQDQGFIFCNDDGSPLNPKYFAKRFQKTLEKAGLPIIRLHDIRHSLASLLLAKGVHPKVVQERLGHSSITITLDRYSHLTQGLQETAAAELEDVFSLSR